MPLRSSVSLAAALALFSQSLPVGASEEASPKSADLVLTEYVPDDGWEIDLSMNFWTTDLDGAMGVGGFVAPVDISFGDILDSLSFAFMGSADIRKQSSRVGLIAEGAYIELAPDIADVPLPFFTIDGISIEQVVASAALYYRVAEWDRGYFDVFAGARYMYLNTGLEFSPDTSGISATSSAISAGIVDELSARVAAAVADAKPVVVSQLERAARARILAGIRDGSIDPSRVNPSTLALARAIAAEQATAVGSSARKKASKAVARLEKKLARELERKITGAIPDSAGGTASWIDPFVGLRAQHYLTERVYLAALADVGGFGVGSELTWNVGGGVGFQVCDRVALEMFYRHMSVDYDDDILFDVDMSGAFLGLKVSF